MQKCMSMRRITFSTTLLVTIFLITACKPGEPRVNSGDPCSKYEVWLNGIFSTDMIEGTMTFTGGLAGEMDVSGVDYNDVTCSYSVTDCTKGLVDMDCQGQVHQETILVYSADSIKIGARIYLRVE